MQFLTYHKSKALIFQPIGGASDVSSVADDTEKAKEGRVSQVKGAAYIKQPGRRLHLSAQPPAPAYAAIRLPPEASAGAVAAIRHLP